MPRSRKFLPPSPPDALLPRTGLLARFDALRWPPTRALLLVAGTGYGKTTFVADACRRAGLPIAWLTLDPEDREIEAFLRGLIAALTAAVPGFTTSAGQLLDRGPDPIAGAMQAVLVLLEELEDQLDGPLVLVLDDYHHADSPAINRVVARVIKYLPADVRLVLTSRTTPDLDLGHLRARRELAEWGEGEFGLDLAEVAALLADQPPEVAADLHARTAGWIAALLLYREALSRTPARAHARWQEFLDDYFEQEVLASQPPFIRTFLLRASLLDAVDPVACGGVLGLEDSEEAVGFLRTHHVFVLEDEDGVLHLHPLFQEFLRARLRRTASPAELVGWAAELGRAQWRVGRYLAALDVWLGNGLVPEAVAAVEGLAAVWSTDRKVALLEGALARLPQAQVPPALALLHGDVLRQWGELDRAMPLLESAREAFVQVGDRAREGRALALLAACWGMRGDLAALRATIEAARGLIAPEDEATEALARNVLGNASLMQGDDPTEAIAHLEASLELSRRLGDRAGQARALHNLGVAHTKLGDFAAAMARYDEGLALATLAGGIPFVWRTPINRCLLLLYLGRAAEARTEAEAVVQRTRQLRYAQEESHALRALAQADVRLGRFDEAEEGLRMAEALLERQGDRAGLANLAHLRSYLAFAQGRTTEALAHEGTALELLGVPAFDARHLEFAQFQARLLVAAGRLDEAEELLSRISGWLADRPYRFHRVEALVTEAELARARQQGDREAEALAVAQELARGQGYDLEALREGPRPAGPASAAPERPPLALRFLGGLVATARGRTVGPREWQSAKAKWLLAYLVEQPAGATKAYLLEHLYDDEATDASVTMTVARLRKALEPGLAPKAPSTYVLFQGGRYVFDALAPFSADTREFLRHLTAAEEAAGPAVVAHLEAALDLYTGDFLPEFTDPWVEGRRQFYRGRATAAALALFDHHLAAGEPDRAVAAAQRAVQIDPCDEAAHRRLIAHFLTERQVHRARDQYRLCADALARFVGLAPSAELTALVAGVQAP